MSAVSPSTVLTLLPQQTAGKLTTGFSGCSPVGTMTSHVSETQKQAAEVKALTPAPP